MALELEVESGHKNVSVMVGLFLVEVVDASMVIPSECACPVCG